jgi:ABC-type ATPase with predicted acetyltransferase domain
MRFKYTKISLIWTNWGEVVRTERKSGLTKVLSAYQEKIPARNAIYAHAQDFSASDELLLAILKTFMP